MPDTVTYERRRGELETYFDRTAADAWARLTSEEPVSRIRATVRAGRDSMRETLLGYLPQDLEGTRVLDAGCGTGAFSIELARRGADVVAIDLSPTLVALAEERNGHEHGRGRIDYRVGDMLDAELGVFDHIVAMDSLIHYPLREMVAMVSGLAKCCRSTVLFTFAPRTIMLTAMHAAGQLFPRGDRSPAIEPVSERRLRRSLRTIQGWSVGDSHRVKSGFYISQAVQLCGEPGAEP